MKNAIASAMCAGFLLAGVQAFAADATHKNSMGSAHEKKMMKDCMDKQQASNTTNMTHDQMMKMCKDEMMKEGAMSKDSMSKDSTRKKKE